jgi:hypothetical protein
MDGIYSLPFTFYFLRLALRRILLVPMLRMGMHTAIRLLLRQETR